MIWGSPPEDRPVFSSHIYDPLWQAASDCNIPLSLHVITGKSKDSDLTAAERRDGPEVRQAQSPDG